MKQFNAHLDICAQCREHPFSLCDEGKKILYAEAEETPIQRYAKTLRAFDENMTREEADQIAREKYEDD